MLLSSVLPSWCLCRLFWCTNLLSLYVCAPVFCLTQLVFVSIVLVYKPPITLCLCSCLLSYPAGVCVDCSGVQTSYHFMFVLLSSVLPSWCLCRLFWCTNLLSLYVCAPVFCLTQLVFVSIVLVYKPPTYEGYHYKAWGEALGWFMASVSFVPVPVMAVHQVWKTRGDSLMEVNA